MDLLGQLRSVVGMDGVISEAAELLVYECDAYTLEKHLPTVVVLPRTPEQVAAVDLPGRWPAGLTREWAWGESTGAGVRVGIVDSGVERGHPLVGEVQSSVAIAVDEDGTTIVSEDEQDDLCGHGTACAGIVRALAPDCEIHSVRVLGAGYTGTGPVLLAGLEHAIRSGYDVINLSLSTTKSKFAALLRELQGGAVGEYAAGIGAGFASAVEEDERGARFF